MIRKVGVIGEGGRVPWSVVFFGVRLGVERMASHRVERMASYLVRSAHCVENEREWVLVGKVGRREGAARRG